MTKITELADASLPLDPTDLVEVVQQVGTAPVNKKVPVSEFGGSGAAGGAFYVAGSAASTTSGTFVDYGTVAVTITKDASTSLIVHWSASFYSNASGTVAEFAIGDGTTDTVCGLYYVNTTNRHDAVSGAVGLTGLPEGPVTLKLRWRRIGGTGSLMADNNDFGSISVIETS